MFKFIIYRLALSYYSEPEETSGNPIKYCKIKNSKTKNHQKLQKENYTSEMLLPSTSNKIHGNIMIKQDIKVIAFF